MRYRRSVRSLAFLVASSLPLTACGDSGPRSQDYTSAEIDAALDDIRTLANHRA